MTSQETSDGHATITEQGVMGLLDQFCKSTTSHEWINQRWMVDGEGSILDGSLFVIHLESLM